MNRQQCHKCRYAVKCYSTKTTPRNVVLNILACRIRNGIDSNNSARLLLDMIRPSLIKLVNNAKERVGSGYIDTESLLMDLDSRVIESLISEDGYKLGETAYLTEFLFGHSPRTGWVKKWILWGFSKHQRFYKKHSLVGTTPKSDIVDEPISDADRIAISNEELYRSEDLDDKIDNTIDTILDIINDGITLNANEYRVMSFCLKHANENNKSRLIDGTHTYLSNIMGVSRPRITRLFSVGRKKILEAAERKNISLS